MKFSKYAIFAIVIISLIFYKLINVPIAKDFNQKWKYRLMYLGSDIGYYFVI